MYSSGIFIFSIWPNNSPIGKLGCGGSRLEGKLNTIASAPSPHIGKRIGFE